MYGWRNSIIERIGLFKSFHCRENKRPLFGFFRDSEYPVFRYPFARKLAMARPLKPEDFNVDEFVADSLCVYLPDTRNAVGISSTALPRSGVFRGWRRYWDVQSTLIEIPGQSMRKSRIK